VAGSTTFGCYAIVMHTYRSPKATATSPIMNMKRIAASVLWLQIFLFALWTIYLAWLFQRVVMAGAGFVPGFEVIEQRRLIATLAPYLVLPFGVTFSFLLFRKGRYRAAASLSFAIAFGAFVAGRLYLTKVPDPVEDNFGARPQPYTGFLVVPLERIPYGFSEVSHHYTRSEYVIRFKKALNNGSVDLDIFESPFTKFFVKETNFIRTFEYQAITGRIYVSHDTKGETTLNLVWLNPPQQRISIYLSQPDGYIYSPDDLIRMLESLETAK
jgi:hypothetical protein